MLHYSVEIGLGFYWTLHKKSFAAEVGAIEDVEPSPLGKENDAE